MTRGRPSRTKLRAWLEETRNFPGTGGIYHFSPSDHNGLSRDAFVMIRIEDGRWVLEP
jgi:branched-chain amino acid transport system substrate-binding protein